MQKEEEGARRSRKIKWEAEEAWRYKYTNMQKTYFPYSPSCFVSGCRVYRDGELGRRDVSEAAQVSRADPSASRRSARSAARKKLITFLLFACSSCFQSFQRTKKEDEAELLDRELSLTSFPLLLRMRLWRNSHTTISIAFRQSTCGKQTARWFRSIRITFFREARSWGTPILCE